jgi:hypothetical protein
MRPFALCFQQRVPNRSCLGAVPRGSCRAVAWPLVVIILLLSFSGPTFAAQKATAEPQNPLQIVHPIETAADLQRELDQLQAESKKLDGLITAIGNKIYVQTDEAVRSAGNAATATVGALFVNQSDYKEIRKTAAEAGTAAKDAKAALEQARDAYQRYLHSRGPEASEQMRQAIAKAAEASDSVLKFETKSTDVYSQTKTVFDRLIAEGRIATGTATPKQAKELARDLAKRFWDKRPEFAGAANDLAQLGQAKEEQDVLVHLKHSINLQIAELRDLKIKQASTPQPLRATARDTSEPIPNPPRPSSARAAALPSDQRSESNGITTQRHAVQAATQNPHVGPLPSEEPSSISAFDPSRLSASDRAAWQRNQAIIARETLGRSASGSVEITPRTTGGQPASGPSMFFEPSTLSPAARAAWEQNQAIMARETLRRNPAIVTTQTLDRPMQASAPQSEPNELDVAGLFEDWRNKGDRAFRNPEEQRAFYREHPELQKYNSIAEWRSPMTEVDRDLNNGSLSIQSNRPSALTPAEQVARKRNEQIVANETLNKLPSTLKRMPDGVIAYDPSALTLAEQAARKRNEQIVANEMLNKLPSTLKRMPDGVITYDPSALTPAEQAARKRNEQIIANETLNKPPSTLKTTPDGVTTYDPGALTSEEQAARKRNEQIIANETLNKPPSTLKTTADGVTTYDPGALTSEEQAARRRNEQIVANKTLPDPQQSVFDWAKTAFPELEGSDGGISFGDMSTHVGPNGLKAVPNVSACLDFSCPKRYFDKDWSVMLGSKLVARGFGDVRFLSGDFFLADPKGGGPYKIYSTATGKSVSDTLIYGFQQANYLGNGYIRIVGPYGNPQWFRASQSPSGVVVSSVPSPLPVSMAVNPAGQCLLQMGMSAVMNHGVSKPPVWGPCFSSQSQSIRFSRAGRPNCLGTKSKCAGVAGTASRSKGGAACARLSENNQRPSGGNRFDSAAFADRLTGQQLSQSDSGPVQKASHHTQLCPCGCKCRTSPGAE